MGNFDGSEKKDKKIWHKRWRMRQKQEIKAAHIEARVISRKEVSDPWAMTKDGKRYHHDLPEKLMRK